MLSGHLPAERCIALAGRHPVMRYAIGNQAGDSWKCDGTGTLINKVTDGPLRRSASKAEF
jgi:hypothetical protein